jgi:hypothetical protein
MTDLHKYVERDVKGSLCDLHTHLLGMGTAKQWMEILESVLQVQKPPEESEYRYKYDVLSSTPFLNYPIALPWARVL